MDELRSSSIMDQGYGNVYKKVLKDRRLTKTAKLIHCYLCSYAGGGTTAFPSASLICYDLDIKDDTYYENMMCLKAYGYITVEQFRDKEGKFSNSVYTIELFPEQKENADIEKEWKEAIEKRKKRRKNWEEKHRTPSERGTDKTDKKIDRTPSERDTVGRGTNNNSNNNILLSLYNKAKERIKKELKNSPSYDQFIEPLQPIEYENDTIIFTVPSDWHRMIIEARYRSIIEMSLKEVYGKEINIVLRV